MGDSCSYLEKLEFLRKNYCGYFLATFEKKLGYFLFQYLVTLILLIPPLSLLVFYLAASLSLSLSLSLCLSFYLSIGPSLCLRMSPSLSVKFRFWAQFADYTFCIATSVTRWLSYLFNIWLFRTIIICPIL